MKWLLWFLLFFNVALLAYFNLASQPEVELQIAETPLNPEKVRLLSPEEIELMPKREVATVAENSQVPQYGCYEWGTFSRAKLASAQNYLNRHALEAKVVQRSAEESTRYWVYIPRVGSAQAAQARMDELRTLGVADMVVVQDQQSANVISLGVFKDEQLATKLLEDLKSKGVSTAVKGVRNQEQGRSSLYISNMSSELVSELEGLQPEFPGSELKLVNCQ